MIKCPDRHLVRRARLQELWGADARTTQSRPSTRPPIYLGARRCRHERPARQLDRVLANDRFPNQALYLTGADGETAMVWELKKCESRLRVIACSAFLLLERRLPSLVVGLGGLCERIVSSGILFVN